MMDLQRVSEVHGWRLSLRLIEPDDAAYVHRLRTDPRYNTHLSAVTGGVAEQRTWIEAYKEREAGGQEAYYVIALADGTPCGLVRLYDIAGDRFTWGSWILDENKPPKAALESAVLSFGVAFEQMNLQTADIDVRRENEHAAAFYRRFGMTETGSDAQNLYFTYGKGQYERDRPRYAAILGRPGIESAGE